MRAFSCEVCGQLLFFENSLCLRCSTPQGFLVEQLALEPLGGRPRCSAAEIAACNWVAEREGSLCASCQLTRTRPNDADAEGLEEFAAAERAKRRLLFELVDLGLPIDGDDLRFDLLSSRDAPVVTGHSDGLITLDLAESDDARREQRRAQLGEAYRTLLGHFRHEIGHYYWPTLIEQRGAEELERCRALFGDERRSYEAALERHYENGPPSDWRERCVSAYATMHPAEDWAETFSHYLHIHDTLQTAAEFRLVVTGPDLGHGRDRVAAPGGLTSDAGIDAIIADWLPLTYALNALNRGMGRDDLYPFTLAPAVIEKLAYVRERVRAGVAPRSGARPLGLTAETSSTSSV
jgi:hypothetical protein